MATCGTTRSFSRLILNGCGTHSIATDARFMKGSEIHTNTAIEIEELHRPKKRLASRAAKGIQPGNYADRSSLVATYETEAEQADQLLAQLDVLPMASIGRTGGPKNGEKRVPLKVYSLKISRNMLMLLTTYAQMHRFSHTIAARRLLLKALTEALHTSRVPLHLSRSK
jgi:hypothetical protein